MPKGKNVNRYYGEIGKSEILAGRTTNGFYFSLWRLKHQLARGVNSSSVSDPDMYTSVLEGV